MSDRYEVIVSSRAARDIRALPPPARMVVIAALDMLATTPRAGKPLVGELRGVWSLRRGDYRVLYRLDDAHSLTEIVRVAHRREVYRRR